MGGALVDPVGRVARRLRAHSPGCQPLSDRLLSELDAGTEVPSIRHFSQRVIPVRWEPDPHQSPQVRGAVKTGCWSAGGCSCRTGLGTDIASDGQNLPETCRRCGLPAFAYDHLRQNDLLSVRTESEKFLMLAVLNLVECIANVRERTKHLSGALA